MSESARANSAAESRFRIDYPNSRPRESRIIALDESSATVLPSLVRQQSSHAHFLRFVQSRSLNDALKNLTIDAVLEDMDGQRKSLTEEVSRADIIVMMSAAGFQGEAAQVVGNACLVQSKTTTGIILSTPAAKVSELAATLAAMRPFTTMLVVSNGGEESIGEMLSALRV